MEVFGVVSSAVQLADISLRVFESLAGFIASVKTAETAAKELKDKVQSLWTTTRNIRRLLQLRDQSIGVRPLSDAEKSIRRTLHRDIEVCVRVLEKFEASLSGLRQEPTHPSWLSKTLLQLQLDKRNAAICRFENFLSARLQIMQVSLACLEAEVVLVVVAGMRLTYSRITNVGNHREVLDGLNNLSLQISRSHDNIHVFKQKRDQACNLARDESLDCDEDSAACLSLARVDSAIARDDDTIEQDFQNMLLQAKEVHHACSLKAFSDKLSDNTSVFSLEDAGRPRLFSSTEQPHLAAPPAIMSPSILSLEQADKSFTDPTPSFNDDLHLEVLEALIDRLRRQAQEDKQKGRYNQAERHQREACRLLEQRHVGYGIPFNDYEDMQDALAGILASQKKHEEALEIRHVLLQGHYNYTPSEPVQTKAFIDDFPDPARALRDASHYHSLAETNYDRLEMDRRDETYRENVLSVAERDAKRAFKLRRHFCRTDDPLFIATVELLLKIYDAQERNIHYETYFNLYISNRVAPSPIPPTLGSVSPRSSFSHFDSSTTGTTCPRASSLVSDHLSALHVARSRTDSTQDDDPLYSTYPCIAGATDDIKIHLDPATVKKLLKTAIRNGEIRAVSTYLERADQRESLLTVALIEATRMGKDQIVQLLLQKKDAKPDSMDEYKNCALHLAAQNGFSNITQQLLDARADPDLVGPDGWTAIHFAIHGGHEGILNTLLHNPRKADVDARNAYGDTGLHSAAYIGNFAFADILVRAGADQTAKNAADMNPLEVAMDRRHDDFVHRWLDAAYDCDVNMLHCTGATTYIRSLVNKRAATRSKKSPDSASSPRPPTSPASPRLHSKSRASESFSSTPSSGSKRKSIVRSLMKH